MVDLRSETSIDRAVQRVHVGDIVSAAKLQVDRVVDVMTARYGLV